MNLKERIRLIVEDNSTKQGRVFDYIIQFIIIFSLISFSLETITYLYSKYKTVFDCIEIIIIVIFTIEYILRVITSKKPIKYIFSFWGIIDLLSTLPFYFRLPFDLRFIRVFRVFRLFRTLKLVKYNRALKHYKVAFNLVKEEFVLFFIVIIILIFLSSCGIYFFENEAQPLVFSSVPNSFWWSIVTLTTVGYGDIIPITIGGRVFTFFILIIGVGVITIPAGLFASSLLKSREIMNEEIKKEKNNFQETECRSKRRKVQ